MQLVDFLVGVCMEMGKDQVNLTKSEDRWIQASLKAMKPTRGKSEGGSFNLQP